MTKLIPIILLVFLSACASMNDALTPDADIVEDEFYGTKEVYQEPVSATSAFSEGWNLLGFRWNTGNPDIVYLLIAVNGAVNVEGLDFRIGNEFIQTETASTLTKYEDSHSRRQFKVSYEDFLKIANADEVLMRVEMIDKYNVSSFGKSKNAAVGSKFPKFLEQIKQLKGS